MRLIFQNSRYEERIIAEPSNIEEAIKEMNKFMNDLNFKSYYTRVWEENGRLKFDVGSWSEFFYLEGMTFDEYQRQTSKRQY